MAERLETLGEVVWELLRRIVREKLARKPGGHLVESQLDTLELRLGLPLSGPAADPREFAARLDATLDQLLDDAVEHAAAFRPGRAYCHRCASPACEHSLPPGSRHVFVGYAPTGLPRWADFAQYCLERKDPRVDQLYDEPPALLTILQEREALEGMMLEAFQCGSYELLGQLTAGFYSVRERGEPGRSVVALTVQVAASRSPGTQLRLGLNLLGLTPTGEGLERLEERHEELPWRKPVRWAQAALETLLPARTRDPRTIGRAPHELERRAIGILQGLARRLEREHRARARRTAHAAARHASGERPTRKALDDARAARGEELLIDERSRTVVVLGERGRTHFFTLEGQHVSSVRYSREAIDRKLKLELWRRASTEQGQAFRARLRNATG